MCENLIMSREQVQNSSIYSWNFIIFHSLYPFPHPLQWTSELRVVAPVTCQQTGVCCYVAAF